MSGVQGGPRDRHRADPEAVLLAASFTVTAMFTGFQVNLYADDVEPGVAFYAAMGFDETCRQYSPAGGRCTSSSRTAG